MHPHTELLRKLPIAEKLQVLEELWDDISASDEYPVPASVVAEAERRSAELKADPSLAITDEELWRRVDESLKDA